MSRTAAAVALVVALLLAPAAARAETGAEVRALARQAAAGDVDALERLRGVREVDAVPVDLASALDVPGRERLARLRTLAGDAGEAEAVDTSTSAAAAADILEEGRFHESSVPRPFRRFLEWLGDRLEFVTGPLRRFVDRLPGGSIAGWLIVAGAVAALAAIVATHLGSRRGAVIRERSARHQIAADEDPEDLEREASEAERRGQYELAVRLRFRAGLIRLARSGSLPPRAELTTGELRDRLEQPVFDTIAETFDEVVYGGREASAADAAHAGDAWPRVLAEARR